MSTEESVLQTFWEAHARWEEHRCGCADPNASPPCSHCTDCMTCWCNSCEDYHMDDPDAVLFCMEEEKLMNPETP